MVGQPDLIAAIGVDHVNIAVTGNRTRGEARYPIAGEGYLLPSGDQLGP